MITNANIVLTTSGGLKIPLELAIIMFQTILSQLVKFLDFWSHVHLDYCIRPVLSPIMEGIGEAAMSKNRLARYSSYVTQWILFLPILCIAIIHLPMILWQQHRDDQQARGMGEQMQCMKNPLPKLNIDWKTEGF